MMGSAPPRRRTPSAGAVPNPIRRTPSSGTMAPRTVNSAPRRSLSSLRRGTAVVTHRSLPASLAALPPPSTFILREDSENGVPQVVHTTFEKLRWEVYDADVEESTTTQTAPKPPTSSSSSTRPPRGASGASTRGVAQTPPSSSSAMSAAQSSWQTFPPYHIHWKTNRFFSSEQATCISPYMRVNHFPWSNEITLKDNLYRNIRRMKGVYGGLLYGSLHPESFTVPNEYIKFSEHFTLRYQKHLDDKRAYTEKLSEHKRLVESMKQKTNETPGDNVKNKRISDDVEAAPPPPPPDQPIFICKPTDMSRGRKIFLFKDLSGLTYDQPSIVQSYIERPLLLEGGRKVDFRIYVLVTSYHPLTVYVYHEFLARFSAAAYNEADISNNFAHLTNYAISRTYESSSGERPMSGQSSMTSVGVKWDGAATRKYFQSHFGVDFDAIVWPRIIQAVNLTLLSVVMSPSFVPTPEAGKAAAPCFELYGFDILVDAVSFQPWLVEVNYSPSLAIEMPIDIKVKTSLIEDIVGVLNVPLSPSSPSTSSSAPPNAPTSTHLGRPYGDFMPCFPPSVASLTQGDNKTSEDPPTPSSSSPTTTPPHDHHLNKEHLTNKCYASFPPPFIAAVEAFRAASGKQAVANAFKDLTLEFRKVENGVKARGLKAAAQLP